MGICRDYLRANRYPSSHRWVSSYFFGSAFMLTVFFGATWLWSCTAQRLMGNDTFALAEVCVVDPRSGKLGITIQLGGYMLVLMLAGMLWLFMTGYASRGAMLYERDRRIAELKRRLGGEYTI